LDLSDHREHEKESKKNWHDHSSLFFSLLTFPDTCQSGIRLPAKFKQVHTSHRPQNERADPAYGRGEYENEGVSGKMSSFNPKSETAFPIAFTRRRSHKISNSQKS
jgi:hypothetical protein